MRYMVDGSKIAHYPRDHRGGYSKYNSPLYDRLHGWKDYFSGSNNRNFLKRRVAKQFRQEQKIETKKLVDLHYQHIAEDAVEKTKYEDNWDICDQEYMMQMEEDKYYEGLYAESQSDYYIIDNYGDLYYDYDEDDYMTIDECDCLACRLYSSDDDKWGIDYEKIANYQKSVYLNSKP